MPSAEEIKQRIEAALPDCSAEVEDWTGGGDHFRATVVSPAFAGRSRIEQHKLVYEVFGGDIGGAIHALSLRTEATDPRNDHAPDIHSPATTEPAPATDAQQGAVNV